MNWKEELRDLREKKLWKEVTIFLGKIVKDNPDNVEVYIEAIYTLLDILLEEDWNSPNFEHDKIAKTLKDLFDESYKKFSRNAEYLFFIGYFMALAVWYFGQEDLELSYQMLKAATKIEPNNNLYEWAYKFSTNDASAGRLSEKLILDAEKMKWLESKGNVGEYMIGTIRYSIKHFKTNDYQQ